jgi:antitoxin component of RelBE/YafQ-DinJ toxin-antitoxin module
MPNQPKTPLHALRIDDALWSAALTKAHAAGCTLSEVIRAWLREYVAEHDTEGAPR